MYGGYGAAIQSLKSGGAKIAKIVKKLPVMIACRQMENNMPLPLTQSLSFSSRVG